jgi:putative transposase
MGEALRALPLESLPETWVSTDVAAELLGVSSRTMLRCLGQYQTRIVPREGRGGERYEVLVGSLPSAAVSRWEARQRVERVCPADADGELLQAYQEASQRARRHFDRWNQVLLASEGIQGRRALQAWCESWNLSHADNPVALQSLYRMRAQVAEQGLIGLLLRDTKLPESSVRDDWFEAFHQAYLNENKLSVAAAHMVALGAARRIAEDAGEEFDPETFPSESAFRRRLEKEFSPAVITFKRDGEKKFFDRHGFYIERDYSSLVSGRIWVGDSRVLDVLVSVDSAAAPVRPWVTLFICMKSHVPMGWHIHTSAPSAENTMRALRHGILRMGKPEWWYLDNGREYRNNEVTGLARGHVVNYDLQHTGSVAAMLGIKVRFAKPMRSRTKPIERQFKEMKDLSDRFWPTFKGGNAVEKPNRLKEILKRPSEVPSFEEFQAELSKWCAETIPHVKSNGKVHQGRSRWKVFQDDCAVHGFLSSVSADTAAMLVTKMARGRIGRRGVVIAALKATWWEQEWMPMYKGREVVVRYDPDDLRQAWCYEATETGHGPIIGTCKLVEQAGAMVLPGDAIGMAQVREGNRQHEAEIRVLRAFAPQAKAADFARMREDFRRGIGARPLEIEQANTVALTPHDTTAARIRRQARVGRAEIPFDPPQPQQPTRELLWHDDQIAAAG